MCYCFAKQRKVKQKQYDRESKNLKSLFSELAPRKQLHQQQIKFIFQKSSVNDKHSICIKNKYIYFSFDVLWRNYEKTSQLSHYNVSAADSHIAMLLCGQRTAQLFLQGFQALTRCRHVDLPVFGFCCSRLHILFKLFKSALPVRGNTTQLLVLLLQSLHFFLKEL